MIKTKIVSSLEKAFLDQPIGDFAAVSSLSVLKGERFSLQCLYTRSFAEEKNAHLLRAVPEIEGALAPFVKFHRVRSVPVAKTKFPTSPTDAFLRTAPGLYPDLLEPMDGGKLNVTNDVLESLWVEFKLPEDAPAGCAETKISFVNYKTKEVEAEAVFTVTVMDAVLPKQTLKVTEWFYTDCLASFYGVEVFSEAHWKIIEKFAKTAREYGINLLLTPIFTPPLDTEVGGERLTTQLVDVKKTNGRYFFSYKKLDRWIEMCNRVGIEYFEISHLFTQWGAEHAPKIMATRDVPRR